MKNNKYFTPNIEDIHVGYECEYQDNYGHEKFNEGKPNWIPIKIKLKDEEGTYTSQLEDILIGMDDGYQPVRVPYLTKEQLEAEGWVVTMREVKPAPYKVDWINAKKEKYSLWINLALTKSMHLGIDDQYGIRYRGECKDINTFRKIIKLLNIK